MLSRLAESAFDRLVSLPPLGPWREPMETGQRLLRAWRDYDRARRAYQARLGAVGPRARRLLVQGLREARPGSLRALLECWLESGQAAYAEVAASDDFLRAQGELINALSVLRGELRGLGDGVTGALGLPTRAELDSAYRRIHDQQRELRGLRRRMAALEAAAGRPGP